MESSQNLRQIENIESKLKRLITSYQELKYKLAEAQEEIQLLEAIIKEKDSEIKNFQNQENIAKIVDNIAVDPANTTELKLKINEYIREIDKCIAYLRD
ncbi:MAG: hypothetical protein LPJ89_08090 [Hymenobacteraceae bacterium]|nr:hypothetical protein [Hymenobacteraceae bacterium]MDX5394743.1 hypothetical protein [Hymenobacteraceae bacterium]MDX5443723.1 hypothetical protein [Hymenobacteraceae bacterium]MDX5510776.1 hypothetical protein [Hymenobacteraceae bacterium]